MATVDWAKFYEIRNATLKVKVTWQVDYVNASVVHILTGEHICEVPMLTGWGRTPTLREFTEYIDGLDWDTILSEQGKRRREAMRRHG